jgi:hypothetical protein
VESLESRVRRAVAEERGVALKRVGLASTLGRDLGMDGDDAVGFFRNFETEFHVDLRALWSEWDLYFASEAWGPVGLLVVGLPILCAVIVLVLLARWTGIRLAGWMEFGALSALGLALWVSWQYTGYWPLRRFVQALREKKQITVADLIAAARRGAWPG